MSVKLMAAVFENEELAPTERLLMLALADHAGDDGRCYPSIDRLCQRTGLSRRAVQLNIQKLQDQGYVVALKGGGRGHSTRYQINANPARNAPFVDEKGAPETPNKMHLSREKGASGAQKGAPDAPEPSRTIIEPPPSARERLLGAMGVGGDGVAGPSTFIGSTTDMAEAERWSAMGLSVSQQCEVIREVCDKQRSKHPGWKPSTFRYFTPAMERLTAAKSLPAESSNAAQIERWKRIANA
jgi:biotin operon repressor